jgi:hypothetical protein
MRMGAKNAAKRYNILWGVLDGLMTRFTWSKISAYRKKFICHVDRVQKKNDRATLQESIVKCRPT